MNDADSVSNSIEESMDLEVEEEKESSSYPESIKALGNIAFKNYPLKDSNITHENSEGMSSVKVLNEYHLAHFGYKFNTLDILVDDRMKRTVSVNGYGLSTLTQLLQSMQVTFETLNGESFTSKLRRKI